MATEITKKEKTLLRQLAQEAWEDELDAELERLFEYFCKWADKGMSATELSDKIHEFHNGVSRELYNRYTILDPMAAVSRAIAIGLLGEGSVDGELLKKLISQIEGFRSLKYE